MTPLQPLDDDTLRAGISRLPALPAVALDLLHSLDDDAADCAELARRISREQGLVARILRVANSSFYGLQGRIGTLQDAIVVLGFRTVRSLATASALTATFSDAACRGFDTREFWRHGIGVAIAAQAVARRLRTNEEGAFTAGLLHDIGRLVLASAFPHHQTAIHEYRAAHDGTLLDAERAVTGTDHARIGQLLTESWCFPPALAHAIAWHHEPQRAPHAPLLCAVHLGDVLARALALCGDPAATVPPVDDHCWAAAALDDADGIALLAAIEQQFAEACEVLVA